MSSFFCVFLNCIFFANAVGKLEGPPSELPVINLYVEEPSAEGTVNSALSLERLRSKCLKYVSMFVLTTL